MNFVFFFFMITLIMILRLKLELISFSIDVVEYGSKREKVNKLKSRDNAET